MSMAALPILYSFRRCPYAIRARFALALSGIAYTIREVDLKNKPAALLNISPKGTVPVLQQADGAVIDESYDIIRWAFREAHSATYSMLTGVRCAQAEAWVASLGVRLIDHINRVKYPDRYDHVDTTPHYAAIGDFLSDLDDCLQGQVFLFSDLPSFPDVMVYPFIRQLTIADNDFFVAHASIRVREWLDWWQSHPLYADVMQKRPVWLPDNNHTA